jgi:hypothetical protein
MVHITLYLVFIVTKGKSLCLTHLTTNAYQPKLMVHITLYFVFIITKGKSLCLTHLTTNAYQPKLMVQIIALVKSLFIIVK